MHFLLVPNLHPHTKVITVFYVKLQLTEVLSVAYAMGGNRSQPLLQSGRFKRSAFLHSAHSGGRAAVKHTLQRLSGAGAHLQPHVGGGGSAGCLLNIAGTCTLASAEGNVVCSRTVRRDVGVPGESIRRAARQQRKSRSGRAVSGRQAVSGRALLRMQPERTVQAVQRQPVRVLY